MTPWITKPVPFNIGQGVAGAAAVGCTYRSATDGFGTQTGDYSVSSEVLQANIDTGYSNNGSSSFYDIGTANISSTAWILRWKWDIEGMTETGPAPAVVACGLYSASASAGNDSGVGGDWSPTQQIAVIMATCEGGGSNRILQACTGKAAVNFYDTTTRQDILAPATVPDTYYLTIKRYDNSGTDTLAYSLSTNPDYETGAVTVEQTSATYLPSSLRYLKIESWQHGGGSGQAGVDTTVSEITFNNDTDEACS